MIIFFSLNNREITKSGNVYIFVSNETPNIEVYFDNLQITHTRSPLLETTDYYPFGLTMAGISSKALSFGGAENHKQFNGIEHTTDLDLNQYDAFFRTLDPQIGRFWQIDPKVESTEAWSPYAAMLDNPIRYADPLGDSIKPVVTYDNNMTPTPTQKSDLGNTTDTYIGVESGATTTNVNIEVDITVSLSGAFVGGNPGTNIELQNPGLEREVKAHEEGHKDQIMDAANLPVTITVDIDGKPTTFTGAGDQVIVNATAAFNSSTAAAGMNDTQKTNFIDGSITTPTLNAIGTNIDNNVYNNPNKETDANNRAAATLGASTIKYNNGAPITFNGITIK